jgi:hypothetical protein
MRRLSGQIPHEADTTGDQDRGRAPAGEELGVPSAPKRSWSVWLLIFGVLLVPGVFYSMILVVPFLPLTTGQKLWVASGLVVAAEGVFLLSALILGREAVRRYRRFFDPRSWFGKNPR